MEERFRDIVYSKQNHRVKDVVKLRDRKNRENRGRFIIEGYKEIKEALVREVNVLTLYYCPSYFREAELYKKCVEQVASRGGVVQEVSREVFEKMAYREGPDGLLAVAKMWKAQLTELKLSSNPLLLVVEKIEKPGNLGTLIRTAEAVGVDAVIVCQPVTDIFNPNVIRASLGMVFCLPVLSSTNEEVKAFLKEQNIQCLAATPHSEMMFWEADMKSATAIFIGSEWGGLTDFWMKNHPEVTKVKIPLMGQGDAINASAAGAVILYEALRQRTFVVK